MYAVLCALQSKGTMALFFFLMVCVCVCVYIYIKTTCLHSGLNFQVTLPDGSWIRSLDGLLCAGTFKLYPPQRPLTAS